jgi:hypothetical protein
MDWESFMLPKCHRINYSLCPLEEKTRHRKKEETHNLTKIIKIFLTKIYLF